MEDRIERLEKRQDAELKKFAEMLDRFSTEVFNFR
jgi:hypothetical protein